MLSYCFVKIIGRVQGVGFRYFIFQNAKRLNLLGTVRNHIDGSVEIEVEGKKNNIEILLEKIKIGPIESYIEEVQVEWKNYHNGYDGFKIIKTTKK